MNRSAVETAGSTDLKTTPGQPEEGGVPTVLGFRDGSHGARRAPRDR